MLKKYKNTGYIYITDENNIKLNNLVIQLFTIHKNLSLDEIIKLAKKEYYKTLKCIY
jgi:hypothetical protein